MSATWLYLDGHPHSHHRSLACDSTCEGPRAWTVELPITTPLSLNDRTHWRIKAKHVAALRHGTTVIVRAEKIPTLARVQVELHYVPRDSRRRDPLNLVATLKAVEDGCVDAGLMTDDSQEHFTSTMPIIDPPAGRASRLYIVIREVLESSK
jgi:crossover junction endodeoxyribonuclease RusA